MKPLRLFSLFCFIILYSVLICSIIGAAESDILDYTDPDAIAEASPSEIDVEAAIENGNADAVTAEQWAYGTNLNLAGDLSVYPEAQKAVTTKYTGLELTLDKGHVVYTDGIIQNGDVSLDLTDGSVDGAIISALAEGGFRVEKGSSEDIFVYDGSSILFGDSSASVEIRSANDIVLSNGADMLMEDGTKIVTSGPDTQVLMTDDGFTVTGTATVHHQNNILVVGDIMGETTGTFAVTDEHYEMHNTFLYSEPGSMRVGSTTIEAKKVLYVDEDAIGGGVDFARDYFTETIQVCDGVQCETRVVGVLPDKAIESIKAESPIDVDKTANKLGVSENMLMMVGVAGLVAADQLPSTVALETEDGRYGAVLGYEEGTFQPYLTIELDNFAVTAEPGISPDTGVKEIVASGSLKATMDLGKVGYVTASSTGGNNLYMTYGANLGAVRSSVRVHTSKDVQSVFATLDLGKVIR